MKKLILLTLIINAYSFGQIIGDNKVQFTYTQLPLVKLDEGFNKYEIRLEHTYLQSNDDSLQIYQTKVTSAEEIYEAQLKDYYARKDSLKRIYLRKMADYQKKENAGLLVVNGVTLAKPTYPKMPTPPVRIRVTYPFLHSQLKDEELNKRIQISGLEKGVGGCILIAEIGALKNVSFRMKKTGTGTRTKYTYSANYSLPVHVKFDSPTQGNLLDRTFGNGIKSVKIKEFNSQYEFELYLMDNKERVYRDIELKARQNMLNDVLSHLNNKFGYVQKSRNAEIYHVKRFKNYEYSDVKNAYNLTVQALNKVKDSKDLSAAQNLINEAISAWDMVMEEYTDADKNARVNKKIGAMIQCNMAELLLWKTDFQACRNMVNTINISSVLKAKTHIKRTDGFYEDYEKRYNANYGD